MQDKAGQVPQHAEEVGTFSIINLLFLFGLCFHQVFKKLRRVFMHIDTRTSAAIAAVAAHRGIDHGLLAALRIATFRVKIGAVSPLPFRPAKSL